ncbi:MAG TPA: ABC transporter substrate-binding protein [Acidimicrobiales bacterium]|jgi:peptide/nickel transport system substrate-binding protein
MRLKGKVVGNSARHIRTGMLGAIALAVVSLMLVGTSSLASASYPTGGTKVSGGTVRWAEPAGGSTPNYIFPFMSGATASVNNISQLQYMLYRPLYMFGSPNSQKTTLNPTLSLASLPTYGSGDTTATIGLKTYKWSDGETVTANDVLFFMNMMHAQKANWFDYTPGYFPDNVKSVVVNSPSSIEFTFNKSLDPTWMTYNEFSQITPFPEAWDITASGAAAGSGDCATGAYGAASTDAACTKVYNFLTSQAQNLAGYATSPIWSIVDGPYTIAASKGGAFTTAGAVTLVPNASYSGPQKATVKVQELPFTSDSSEYDSLLGGNLDIGWLPNEDATAVTKSAVQPGPNSPRLSGYYLTPWVLYGFNYATLKFESTGDNGNAGAIFSQLYVRQALQSMVDQPAMITKYLKGYGVPTYGPVPVLPANNLVDSFEQSNPYPYSPSHAKSLLTSHGWKVVPGGTDTCVKPGTAPNECGAGISQGAPLSFTMAYATGIEWHTQVMNAEQSAWNSVGIHVSVTGNAFTTVIGDYVPPCVAGSPCTVEAGWWGGGWEYSPDYYPSGETLFSTGAGSNSSNYSNGKADSLISATTDTNTNLDAYQNYIAKQLPFVWEPNADYQLTEVANNLRGVAPQNPFANLFPEYWYYVKK